MSQIAPSKVLRWCQIHLCSGTYSLESYCWNNCYPVLCMCISLFCNCINYLPNQFTQIISNLRNWDEKTVQFFFHDLLIDFHSVKIYILIQIFLLRIQFLEVKCPKSVRCQQKHLWHTTGCNKENPSKGVTECNKRTRQKYQNKNRIQCFATAI